MKTLRGERKTGGKIVRLVPRFPFSTAPGLFNRRARAFSAARGDGSDRVVSVLRMAVLFTIASAKDDDKEPINRNYYRISLTSDFDVTSVAQACLCATRRSVDSRDEDDGFKRDIRA